MLFLLLLVMQAAPPQPLVVHLQQHLDRAGSRPLLLTTGLMAPEAYTLTAAIEAHVRGSDVREAAAQACHRRQNCGIRAARRLFR